MGKISISGDHLLDVLKMLMPQLEQGQQDQGYDGVSYDGRGDVPYQTHDYGDGPTPPGPPPPPVLPGPPPPADTTPGPTGAPASGQLGVTLGPGSGGTGGVPPPPPTGGRPPSTTPDPGGVGSTDEWGNVLGLSSGNQSTLGGKTMDQWQSGGGLPPGYYRDPQGTLRQKESWRPEGPGSGFYGAGHGQPIYGPGGMIIGFNNQASAQYAGHEGQNWNPDNRTWSGPDTRQGAPPPSASRAPVVPVGGQPNPRSVVPRGNVTGGKPGGGPKGGPIDDTTGGYVPPTPPYASPYDPFAVNSKRDAKTHSGYDGTSYDAYDQAYGSPGSYPSGAQTLGGGTYPWLQRYEGEMTAPMSGEENEALSGMGNFVSGGMGLGSSKNYLNDVLGGKYLDVANNPYLAGIKKSGQGLKDYQDANAHRKIQSSMAAGGNALSGATASALGDYDNNSNNQFDQMMNQMYNQNYMAERGYQNQAPGQMNNLANTEGRGWEQYGQMAALPRQLQQQEDTAQYQDWLRQIGSMNSQNKYSDQLAQQMLASGGYRGSSKPDVGSSQWTQLLAMLGLGGGKSGNGLIGGENGSLLSTGSSNGLLNQLFNSLFGPGGGKETPDGAPDGDPQGHTPDGGTWSAFNDDPNSPDYNPDTTNWDTVGDGGWGQDEWTADEWGKWLGDNGLGGEPGSEG